MQADDHVQLGIDTATRFLSLAIWRPGTGLVAEFAEDVGRDHARRIVPELSRLLQDRGLEPTHIHAIGVGVGPGSYAGLRVGVATAKGLARAWAVPLAGASTLAAIASRGLAVGERGVAVIDARRGNVYAAAYEASAGQTGTRLSLVGGPLKLAREALHARFGADAERVIEGVPPDAGFSASQATSSQAAEAVYL